MELDTANRAALQLLQDEHEPLAQSMLQPRGFSTCPHCRQGFGSASFAIHVARCRALYAAPEPDVVQEDERMAQSVKPKKIKPMRPLVDLCLRFIFRNFQTACMDRIASQAEEEAALIDSIPTSLVHRIVVTLVNDAKQLEDKDARRRVKFQVMKAEVQSIQRENVRLETFRQQSVSARARLHEQEAIGERLRKSLEVQTQEMAATEAKTQQLRSQYDGFEKQQHRQEAKINSLNVEVNALKAALKAAQKKEMEAIKQLASFTKNANVRSASAAALTSRSSSENLSSTAAKRCLERVHSSSSPTATNSDFARKTSNLGAGFKRLNANKSVVHAASCGRHEDPTAAHASCELLGAPADLCVGQFDAEMVPILAFAVPFNFAIEPLSRLRTKDAAAAHERARAERSRAGGGASPGEPTRAHRGVLVRAAAGCVQEVLSEMVYDVETCEHECEVTRLKRELAQANSALSEYQQRESELIQERQQAYEYAAKVEQHGKKTVGRFNEHIRVVLLELAKKEILEKELNQVRQQNDLTAQLSKELANAQRDIRELHRRNSIQSLLKGSNALAAATGSRGAVRAGQTDFTLPRDAMPPLPSPVSPSSTSSRSSTTSSSSSPASNNQQLLLQQLVCQPNEYLVRCPDKLLMHIFAFLEANSVFVVSLTNHSLLARVHVMFGMTTSVMATTTAVGNGSTRRSRTAGVASAAQAQASPRPRLQPKNRSHSSVTVSEKEKAQLSKVEMIVKSLKKDEIKLFHEMSTRVKTLEGHLGQVQAEKEDLAARLHGAENVRDFLMDKLRDLEDTLTTTMETNTKKDEQSALDREIIGFLDAKTQEYEFTLKKCAKKNEDYRAELARLHEEHGAKFLIIQDMVQLLNQEKQDLELQLRSQRKVLVREVKVLRAQNQQLETEKEQYFMQLKQLKHALHHLDEL